ncbi:MAG TPA: SDR family NAD(P)-dependent oxidoreductase [Nitrospira sp.]|jgi:3-oxoacyl-[acyl-carrier protein] reductase|nr:SDR family NAD(P)-dependent oxidoreductase [Nitrospira sp.]
MKLKDKAVLITGAGSGLGREMALTFAREGARVGVNDVRPESAANVTTEIERAGGRAVRLAADVSDSGAVKKMMAQFVAAFGTIDVLINNAGIGRVRPDSEATPTAEKTDEDWHLMIATHLDATFYCTREALKVMIEKKSGRIINLGSIVGLTGIELAADYGAAKGGIISFTRCVAREVVRHGILVNCIAPGFIETPMTAPLSPELRRAVIARTPIGRFGEPRDIAAAALFLACEESAFMVGQVISPNGGYVI